MVLDMAGQNFLQPVSSWISRMCEAVYLTGGATSVSVPNNAESRTNGDQDSEHINDYEHSLDQCHNYEEFYENPPLVIHSDAETWTSDEEETVEWTQQGVVEAQIEEHYENPPSERSSNSAIRIREESSFVETHSLIPEDEKYVNDQLKTLLRDIETPSLRSTGPINDLDILSYQSYNEEEHVSVHSGRASVAGEPQSSSRMESGSLCSHQVTMENQEMETAFSNNGFEGHEATDSSSGWSPEEQLDSNLEPPTAHVPISKCGDLDVVFNYKPSSQKLFVTIVEAKDIPDKDRSGVNTWQVHVVLLPNKKQRGKTPMQKGNQPVFNVTFTFNKLEPEEMANNAIRFRLYAVHKVIREKMMGEKLFSLRHIKSDEEIRRTLVLEPRSNLTSGDSQFSISAISRSDSASSSQSLSHGGVPELLVGLAYNATTGRLSVQLIKGSHFRNLAINRPPDTYGKLSLLNGAGHELSRCKTSIRRGQPNPVYKETFIFQVALFQLTDVMLTIAIYNRRTIKRKEMIGWISLGQNGSGEEEINHWLEMKESKGQEVCQWHTLLEA